MNELIAFLNARLDEDEAAAQAATPGRWEVGGSQDAPYLPRDYVHAPDYRPEGFSQGQNIGDAGVADGGMGPWAVHVGGSGFPFANATHIARHDPARVLREVAAGRAFLALVERYLTEDPGAAPWDGESQGLMDAAIRARLAVYSGHPDYRDEWATGSPASS